jgi:hypothetical protein
MAKNLIFFSVNKVDEPNNNKKKRPGAWAFPRKRSKIISVYFRIDDDWERVNKTSLCLQSTTIQVRGRR